MGDMVVDTGNQQGAFTFDRVLSTALPNKTPRSVIVDRITIGVHQRGVYKARRLKPARPYSVPVDGAAQMLAQGAHTFLSRQVVQFVPQVADVVPSELGDIAYVFQKGFVGGRGNRHRKSTSALITRLMISRMTTRKFDEPVGNEGVGTFSTAFKVTP